MSEPAAIACKCCAGAAPWFGRVDFSKSCIDRHLGPPAPDGWEVDYHRCAGCGFLFSTFLDGWSAQRLKAELYNDDYLRVDPEFVADRPERLATVIEQMFGRTKTGIRILDYGAGSGELVRRLQARGFAEVGGFDPFHGSSVVLPRVDLMLCFEVIEHLGQPDTAFAAAAACLKDPGVLFFSTLIQPPDIQALGADWWYVAPRNGHVSMHTSASLAILAKRHGFVVRSLNETLHLAWHRLPGFAAHLVGRPPA